MEQSLDKFITKINSSPSNNKDSLQLSIIYDSKTFNVIAHLINQKNEIIF
jgi:hypothetical protein